MKYLAGIFSFAFLLLGLVAVLITGELLRGFILIICGIILFFVATSD